MATGWVAYPDQGSPKAFGYLAAAKKWAKDKANEQRISVIIYSQGEKRTKTHHVYPDKMKTNPVHKFTTRKAAKAYQRVVGGKRRLGSKTVRTNPASIKVHPGRLVEGRKKAQARADKTGQPVSLLQQFFKPSGKMVWTTYDTVYPSKPPTLPNNGRFVPAIVKVKGKAYNVEARRNPTTGRVQIRTNPATARKINPSSAVGQDAFDAGKRWRTTGAYSDSGVANARVVRYGFLKWYNGHSPSVLKGQKKSELEKGFREGYAAGKKHRS